MAILLNLVKLSDVLSKMFISSSSSFSCFSAGPRLTPHCRTREVRPGRTNKKLELHYDYDVNSKGMILNY